MKKRVGQSEGVHWSGGWWHLGILRKWIEGEGMNWNPLVRHVIHCFQNLQLVLGSLSTGLANMLNGRRLIVKWSYHHIEWPPYGIKIWHVPYMSNDIDYDWHLNWNCTSANWGIPTSQANWDLSLVHRSACCLLSEWVSPWPDVSTKGKISLPLIYNPLVV